MAQYLPVDEFHRDEVQAFAVANLIDVRDVRMIEGRRGLCLLDEAPHSILISRNFGPKNLQCDFAIQFGIQRQINFAHSARANL